MRKFNFIEIMLFIGCIFIILKMNNEWELLNPNVIQNINALNNNLVKLMDDIKLLTAENKQLKETVSELKEQVVEMKEIKTFLEENRRKYTQAFNDINNKIQNTETKLNGVIKNNLEVQMNNTKSLHNDIESIGKQFTQKLFDPDYRLRVNNIRWRKQNSSIPSYINHES
jgi:chromosome segregation ATPase